MEEHRRIFAKRLKSMRKRNRQTLGILADLTGMSAETIRIYESGKATPSAGNLHSLADFFDVTMDYLWGASDRPNPLE